MRLLDLSERELDLDGTATGLFQFNVAIEDENGPIDPSGWTVSAKLYAANGADAETFTTSWLANVLTLELSTTQTGTLGYGNWRWALEINDHWILGGGFSLARPGFDPSGGCGAIAEATVIIQNGTVVYTFSGIAATGPAGPQGPPGAGVVTSNTVLHVEAVTQSAYNLLAPPDANTLYFIVASAPPAIVGPAGCGVTSATVDHIEELTQAAYDLLSPPDPNTLYFISA